MAARKVASILEEGVKPDMTPMIDICFQLITFFVMLMTLARDDAATQINLPVAMTAPVLEDDQNPNSISINVDKRSYLLGWGLQLNLKEEAGFAKLENLLKLQADIEKENKRRQGSDWRKEGLETTVIVRIDSAVDYSIFRRIMDICRSVGFTKFQLKAKEEEEKAGGKA